MNLKFEIKKLEIGLNKSGKLCKVKRQGLNKFKEPNNILEDIVEFKGLYHEQNSYIKLNITEQAQYVNKKIPMILCKFEDVGLIKQNDILTYNNKDFKVTGITNIQEWNLIADISLEVI